LFYFKKRKYGEFQAEPVINDDLKNCWQCANCVSRGFTKPDDMFLANIINSGNINSTGNNTNNSILLRQFMTPISHTTPTKLTKPTNPDAFENSFSSSSPSLNNHASNSNSNSSAEFNVPHFSSVKNEEKKKKRGRRSKNELHRIARTSADGQMSKRELDFCTNTDNACVDFENYADSPELVLTVETLTAFQKQVILREFCEICYITEKSPSPKKPSKSPKKTKVVVAAAAKPAVDLKLKLMDRPISGKNFEGEEIIIEDEDDDDDDDEIYQEINHNESSSSKSINSSPVSSLVANKSDQDDTIFMEAESEQYFYQNERSSATSKIINASKTATSHFAKAH
jgi:hypothetical protein